MKVNELRARIDKTMKDVRRIFLGDEMNELHFKSDCMDLSIVPVKVNYANTTNIFYQLNGTLFGLGVNKYLNEEMKNNFISQLKEKGLIN